MFKFVDAKAKTCKTRKTHKKLKTRQQPLVPIELQTFEPGECWSMDIMSIGKLDYLVCGQSVSVYDAGKVSKKNNESIYKGSENLDNILWNTHTVEIRQESGI